MQTTKNRTILAITRTFLDSYQGGLLPKWPQLEKCGSPLESSQPLEGKYRKEFEIFGDILVISADLLVEDAISKYVHICIGYGFFIGTRGESSDAVTLESADNLKQDTAKPFDWSDSTGTRG